MKGHQILLYSEESLCLGVTSSAERQPQFVGDTIVMKYHISDKGLVKETMLSRQ